MESNLQLIITKNFNGIAFDCYQDSKTQNEDFWATREQIGRLLEYENPANAIKDIHARHAERINNFSTWRSLRHEGKSGMTTRSVIMYNFRGLLEICRYSNQPVANKVIDFLWNIADEIRKTGYFGYKLNALNIRAAELLKDIAQYASKEEKAIIIREAFKLVTGHDMGN